MYWIYELFAEDGNTISYHYARESHILDGIIVYDKQKDEIVSFDACSNDKESKFCEETAISKFIYYIVEKGFPQKKSVVCG